MRRYQGSKVLYFSFPSMFRNDPARWLLYFILIPALGAGLVLMVRWWFKNYGNRLVLTAEEATYIKGVFNTSMTEIRIADIRAVEVHQQFWEKMVGIGTIRIASAGSDGWEIDIQGMPSPGKIRHIINEGRHGASSDD